MGLKIGDEVGVGAMVVRKVFFLFLEKNTQKTPKKNTQKKHPTKIKKHQRKKTPKKHQ